jgi:hypothetical protein
MSSKCLLHNGQNKSALSSNTSTKALRFSNTNEGRSWERTIVLPIHCKDEIKISEVWGSGRPGYWGHLNPPLLGSCYHPWVSFISLNPCNTSSVLVPLNGLIKCTNEQGKCRIQPHDNRSYQQSLWETWNQAHACLRGSGRPPQQPGSYKCSLYINYTIGRRSQIDIVHVCIRTQCSSTRQPR